MSSFQKPMLCEFATPETASSLGDEWVVEKKYDGVRALVFDSKLYDRRGQDITDKFPEFSVGDIAKGLVLDGEIVVKGGVFADVSGRMHLKDKFTRHLLSRKQPCVFVVFDVPSVKGTLEQRRDYLNTLVLPEWISVAEQYSFGEIGELWGDVLRNGEEGLVVKFKHSFYEWSRRSNYWLKVKAFRECQAEFVKFEEHPKGITIETADARRVVVNGKQADAVKQKIIKSGRVLVNIQYLPQNESDAWRFPSFRGIVGTNEGES